MASCGGEKKNSPSSLIETNDTAAAVQEQRQEDLSVILKGITISSINQFIHPQKGLWLIQSAGAVPAMANISQVDKNFPVDFSSVKQEELPKTNCDSPSFWTKDGCFAKEVNTFIDEKIWTYCGLRKEDISKVEELADSVSVTAINTSLYARYYFSRIDGKWYLTFADLRKPCNA